MQATKSRRAPGKAPGEEEGKTRAAAGSDVRERLLDTAELLFAELGYASCTFRVIAANSGINQGLLHYYFGSKQNLFSEAFLRRARVVAAHRTALLDEAEAAHGAGKVPLDVLVRGFISPALSMATQGPGGRAFVRIHSQLR